MTFLAAALLLWIGCAPTRGAELQETLTRAYEDFMFGRLEESSRGYGYLTILGVAAPEPNVNLAVINRDMGKHDSALSLWIKSSLLDDAEDFVWNQRGWATLALDRPADARTSFLKALERSTSTASQTEANFGLGLTAILDSHPKAATAPLRDALMQSPYLLPAVSYLAALTAAATGDKQAALAYLRQSINLDPTNLEAIKELARLNQKIGENKAAWRAYRILLSLDPADPEAAKNIKKVAKYIPDLAASAASSRRLARPLLNPNGQGMPEASRHELPLRVALFTAEADGKPSTTLRMYFMSNAPFRVVSAPSGEVVKEDGAANAQWEIIFRPENNIVEIRDTVHTIQYTSKQPFRIVPQSRYGSVLIKSAEFVESFGFDPGDRELRGALEVIPTPYGFKLVNVVMLEDYVYGAVGAALPESAPHEAYKAQAVVSRTKALWHKARKDENLEQTDLCDSGACQKYLGLSAELAAATRGAAETEGMVLKDGGRYAEPRQHANCGGMTEDHVSDGPTPARLSRTPAELERWTHHYPPRDRYCEAGALSTAVQARWVRVLSAEDLKERASRIKEIGSIRHLRAARRSPTGRVLALEVVGSRGSLALEGDKAIEDFLSPGSLRSTLFTIQPLMKGSSARHFILWGAGTGHGRGLCRAGAVGQASLGRPWQLILAHYFPNFKIEAEWNTPKATLKEASTKKRPKNPRWKK